MVTGDNCEPILRHLVQGHPNEYINVTDRWRDINWPTAKTAQKKTGI